MHVIERRIEIEAPIERVFDFFSDFESFPRWMKNIREVHYTGRRFTRWAAEAPLGTEVEWEAETTHFEPDRRIAWRSVRGDIDTEGEVSFEETRRGTTLVRVILGYALPAGRFGEMVARLFGKNPQQQLEDDLERFAAVVEGRHSRHSRARVDENGRDANMRPMREARFDERPASDRTESRRRDYYADADRRRVRQEETPYRERRPRSGFDEALHDAQRSQLEGRRRYAMEQERRQRERDDKYVYSRAPEYERAEHWEEPRRRGADVHDDERNEPRSRQRRHALTPRERELERGRHEPDYGYSEQAFRRGVDKLMDEPPSERWRRWE